MQLFCINNSLVEQTVVPEHCSYVQSHFVPKVAKTLQKEAWSQGRCNSSQNSRTLTSAISWSESSIFPKACKPSYEEDMCVSRLDHFKEIMELLSTSLHALNGDFSCHSTWAGKVVAHAAACIKRLGKCLAMLA
eukprot:scaffold54125_cov14-Tisochrysis_lutea.AAC.1